MLSSILKRFGLNNDDCIIQQFDSGLINKTWKVSAGNKSYILQKINDQVFKKPEDIDKNLSSLKKYLNIHHPEYLFVGPLATSDGATLIQTSEGYFRFFDFIGGSRTITSVSTCDEAYEAARQFGKFSKLLSGFDADGLAYTLPDFHNLILRYQQFADACLIADRAKLNRAGEAIAFIKANEDILHTYQKLVNNQLIPHRAIHHDTKISNVLFDVTGKSLCVIDLDTVMPGFYISDVGDMMRTYLSPANEEETDLTKIMIRTDFFRAVYLGYLSEMGSALTNAEKNLFIYSGEFIIYMQAIRFLTDYLNNDVYYGTKYPDHNLKRALNQITLLEKYMNANTEFQEIIAQSQSEPAQARDRY